MQSLKNLNADRVLILPDKKADTKTSGGIYLTEKQDDLITGTVVLVGPGYADRPQGVVVGQHVAFNNLAGTDVIHHGVKHILISSTSVIGEVFDDELGSPSDEVMDATIHRI